MFAEEYWDIQIEKNGVGISKFFALFWFWKLENETLNKQVEKKPEEELGKSGEDQVNTIAVRTLQAWLQQSD